VEKGQVAQKQHACHVEKASHKKCDCKLLIQVYSKSVFRVRDQLIVCSHLKVNNEATSYCVHRSHEKGSDNQPEKKDVVLLTHAVVDPPAVVVESIHATVTGAAVL